jgi:phytol kinase
MSLALTVLAVLLILIVGEIWWRRSNLDDEFSRKFVHITVGSFVAFWPYFLSATEIKLLSVAFLLGVGISRYVGIFNAIHTVQRPTWGEVWFAIVVGVLAFSAAHPHIYTVALLEMSLADGFAAVVGTRFGNGSRYTIFGMPKSVVGTATFLAISCVLLAGYVLTTPGTMPGYLVLPVALGATVLENASVRGLDNLVVPFFVAAILRLFG